MPRDAGQKWKSELAPPLGDFVFNERSFVWILFLMVEI